VSTPYIPALIGRGFTAKLLSESLQRWMNREFTMGYCGWLCESANIDCLMENKYDQWRKKSKKATKGSLVLTEANPNFMSLSK
jgi:hypothetical protein